MAGVEKLAREAGESVRPRDTLEELLTHELVAGHACRKPAMKNFRCRQHGGKSDGPRTAAGLAHSRRARWVHGGRSQGFVELRREGMAIRRRINELYEEIAARMALNAGATGTAAQIQKAFIN